MLGNIWISNTGTLGLMEFLAIAVTFTALVWGLVWFLEKKYGYQPKHAKKKK